MLDFPSIHRQFPILEQKIEGQPLIYLDTAATAQKPHAVLDAMHRFYGESYANPHRGMHVLAERATVAYEEARKAVSRFLHAAHAEEIVFTKNATESINLVAKSWGKASLRAGDRIVLSVLEHHSNIVPWLQLKDEIGIEVVWIDIEDDGRLRMENLERLLADGRTKLVCITAQSNVLGVRPPVGEIVERAHAAGALVLVDAAQHVAHHPTDVRAWDCDFLVFSGHKLYGPTGIGVLYGKIDLLDAMPAFLGGGSMINDVAPDHFTAADVPARFEAGTQPVAEAIGLHAAIDWLGQFAWADIEAHEQTLMKIAHEELRRISGLRVLGPNDPADASGCVSFAAESIHPHDLTEILGRQGICLRAGHHCAQPLHQRLGIGASARMSFGLYTTQEEIRTTSARIAKIAQVF